MRYEKQIEELQTKVDTLEYTLLAVAALAINTHERTFGPDKFSRKLAMLVEDVLDIREEIEAENDKK
jgi:hypothetical protein